MNKARKLQKGYSRIYCLILLFLIPVTSKKKQNQNKAIFLKKQQLEFTK